MLNIVMPEFFAADGDPGTVQQAELAYKDCFDCTGTFEHLHYPELGASDAVVRELWALRQPSYLLRKLARALLAAQPSQAHSERLWAELSRQCSPSRSRLSAKRKADLLSFHVHWPLMWGLANHKSCQGGH